MSDQPSYPDAIGSFVNQSVRLAAAEREIARLREAIKRVEALAAEAETQVPGSAWAKLIREAIEGKEDDVPEVRRHAQDDAG